MGKMVDQPASAIYFNESSGMMAKSLGARIRDQGAMVRLIWSHLFRGPEDMVENAKAVVIEEGCSGAAKIARCYARFASDCEIHFVDRDGKFIDEPDYITRELRANAALPGQGFANPKAALANLKASESQPKPDPEKRESEDFGGAPSEVSSEADEPEASDDFAVGFAGEDPDTELDRGVHSEEVSLEDDSDR